MFKTATNGFQVTSPLVKQKKALKTSNLKKVIQEANQNLLITHPLQRIVLTPHMDMSRIPKEGQSTKSRVINYHKSAMTPAFEKLEENSSTKVLKDFSSSKIQLH
jgi:hypothetical protein